MDGRKPAEGVTDAALEREIEAALAVDPSPEFVAKIRARVASEPAPASWWHLRWPVLATAAVAAVVVAMVALSWQSAHPELVIARNARDIALAPAPQAIARPSEVASANVAAPTRRVSTAGRRGRSPSTNEGESGASEVLISRDEQRAFAMLVTAVQEGRFQRALAPTANAPEASAEPMDISIPPLVIEPLPQIAALGGEEQ